MASTLASTSGTTTIDVTYIFVWEDCTDEQPQPPGSQNRIHITSFTPEEDTKMTQSDDIENLHQAESADRSPRSNCIHNSRWINYTPCIAHLKWRTYTVTLYCLYEKEKERFESFEVDEKNTDPEFLDNWEPRHVEVGHSPPTFHSHVLEGTKIRDDVGNLMLFVRLDTGIAWTVQLYGKLAEPGLDVAVLTDKDKKNLGIE